MKTFTFFMVLATFTLNSLAQKFTSKNITYEITSEERVEVTSGTHKYRGDIIIPEKVIYNNKEYTVTAIGDMAFIECENLDLIKMPNSIETIGEFAFYKCPSINSMIIPSSVTKIGKCAFFNCTGLTFIEIPKSVTIIEDDTFFKCSNLNSIKLPDFIKKIGSNSFRYCSSLESITIPNSVIEIGPSAFEYCSALKSITIHNSISKIGRSAFAECEKLEKITIPPLVTKIMDYTFFQCSNLKTVDIPNSITDIGKNAFSLCESLSQIKIPASITKIGSEAFLGCTSLKSINSHIENINTVIIGNEVFNEVPKNGTLHVPIGKIGDYQKAAQWRDFTNIKEITEPVPVESIELNKTKLEIKIGTSIILSASVKPDDATNKSITWKSNNETIATVDKNGKVNTWKEGTVIISAIAQDGSNLSAICKITVVSPTAIKDIDTKPQSIWLHPNPTSSNLTIETDQQGTIQVVNQLGQTMEERKTTKPGKHYFMVSSYPSGTYFVRFINKSGTIKTEKLIVQ